MSDVLSGRDLLALSDTLGGDYRVDAPGLAPGGATMRGVIRYARLYPGLYAHSTDVLDLHDSTVQVMLTRQLNVVLALEGRIDVSFDGEPLRMAVDRRRRQGQAEGALIALPEAALFTRRADRGKRERKVSISVDGEWLEARGLDALRLDGGATALARGGLAIHRWRPSAKAVALAEQIHSPPAYAPPMQNLYLESRAIEILSEALLAATRAPSDEACALRPRSEARMRELRAFLDSEAAEGLSLAAIAAHAGSNASSLQREFRAVFGMTVFAYLRERNLLRARAALEREGVSVAMAADIAGYTSAANFATAYRRRFGITPKQSRAWV